MELSTTRVLKNFEFTGSFVDIRKHNLGHIHDTYIATFKSKNEEPHLYVLQRININVFKNPRKLIENIEKVTNHLRKKITAAGGNPNRETLTLMPTKAGKKLHKTPAGEFWRAYLFIQNTQTYETIQGLEHLYHTSKAFGRFQNLLRDFPARELHETIPDFHHTPQRLKTLLNTVENDPQNRARFVQEEIEFVMKRAQDAPLLTDLIQLGELPLRVTHNDTKFNNVLIDNESGEGICVIDLDTVMPGLSLYDFGDAIRSGTNPASEDELDPAKSGINLKLFEGFVDGYLNVTRDFLTPLVSFSLFLPD